MDETSTLSRLLKKYPRMQLATLVDSPPATSQWIHEVKYDGYRILVFVCKGNVNIITRNGHDWTRKFRIIADAFSEIDETFVIDGEAVVMNSQGTSDFQALQRSLLNGTFGNNLRAYFFDVLYWNGIDYSSKPFRERRRALERLFRKLPARGRLFVSETVTGNALSIIKLACRMGLEGIISKKLDARYQPGRSKSWLKNKCVKQQEFVITGFVPASDYPNAVGALHLGYYKNKQLKYAGKVGTGFNTDEAVMLFKRLHKLARREHPFAQSPGRAGRDTVWVKPGILCEVKFAQWTPSGKIRHASYQGLRMDKQPAQVTREKPKPAAKIVQNE